MKWWAGHFSRAWEECADLWERACRLHTVPLHSAPSEHGAFCILRRHEAVHWEKSSKGDIICKENSKIIAMVHSLAALGWSQKSKGLLLFRVWGWPVRVVIFLARLDMALRKTRQGSWWSLYVVGFDQHLQYKSANVHETSAHRNPELLLLSQHCKHQLKHTKSMFSEMVLSATFLQAEVQGYKHTTTNTWRIW